MECWAFEKVYSISVIFQSFIFPEPIIPIFQHSNGVVKYSYIQKEEEK